MHLNNHETWTAVYLKRKADMAEGRGQRLE